MTTTRRVASAAGALLLFGLATGCGKTGTVVGRKVLAEAAGLATSAVGKEVLHQQQLRHADELGRVRDNQRFGNPGRAADLRGAGEYHYRAQHQLRLRPNVYGGWNYYRPDGQAVAFSVPELAYSPSGPVWTGRHYFFDPEGRPIH